MKGYVKIFSVVNSISTEKIKKMENLKYGNLFPKSTH